MTFSATALHVDNVVVVDISGRMEKGQALEQLSTAIDDALETCSQFAFRMAGITSMDEEGLRAVYECYTAIPKGQNKLKLIQVPEKVQLIFTHNCGNALFEYFDDEQAALASFKVKDP